MQEDSIWVVLSKIFSLCVYHSSGKDVVFTQVLRPGEVGRLSVLKVLTFLEW